MKKLLLFFAVAAITMTTMAQQKVAILETVDKSGEISYGVKFLLRSSLTTAISQTPGYEGYDRVDMEAIAKEQEFQHTGNVSEDQIKQIGVATGAAYVLVAEAAKYDDNTIIITAKLLDVETFGVKNSAVRITGTSPDEMKKSCELLSKELLPKPKNVTIGKRSQWFGIDLGAGFGEYSYESPEWKGGYSGLTWRANVCFCIPLSKIISVGPFLGFGAIPDSKEMDPLFSFGGLFEYYLENNTAIMFGIGGCSADALNGFMLRMGYKFESPFYLIATYENMSHDDSYEDISSTAFLIGLGWSIGGKIK